ncbi:MAG: exodeoxyribonuclease VII large subunit [Myxococcota bacterium]
MSTLTVSQLVAELKQVIEARFIRVCVTGEISSFRAWRSGHWYFDLKDEQAMLPCVWFQAQQRSGGVQPPADGTAVVLHGRICIYAPQGRMQLVVDSLQVAGQGALAAAFERLKLQLQQEGLFDAQHKKPLPLFARKVGIVTSKQGAALQDMLRILRTRMPGVHVLLAPSRVQGEGAHLEIAMAIESLDQLGQCDVIIVGRGGGSLEDLWCFNEQEVVRAVYACRTPIVSAVGHETDFTLTDFAADERCATPTHAAQTVVPDCAQLQQQLHTHARQLQRCMQARLHETQLRLQQAQQRLADPRLIIAPFAQRLDLLAMRHEKQARALALTLQQHQQQLSQQQRTLHTNQQQRMQQAHHRVDLYAAALQNLSPQQVLQRGYGIVQQTDPSTGTTTVVSHCRQVDIGQQLQVHLHDGALQVSVTNKEETA